MKKIIMMLVGVGMTLNSAIAAPAVSDISARQRYPWNGLVDLKFTITGESGMKYDVSFTAKDMEGNTNVAMKTIRKSDGSSAAAVEQLLPGSYDWVWDAPADLPKDFVCERVVVTGTAESRDIHEKVQLWEGGPYWATTNIGADEPWESGYYFWWGDTVGYKRENDKWVATDGSSSNYSFGNGNTPTYNMDISTLRKEGWITSNNVLAPKHDAAHVKWGGNWRMPTEQEFEDLISKCDWTWDAIMGVNGWVFGFVIQGKGDYDSKSIFLPAVSQGVEDRIGTWRRGYYWSSVPRSDNYHANDLYFSEGSITEGIVRFVSYNARNMGRSVRPVQSATK